MSGDGSSKGLVLIGAGLPRTGTTSVKVALEKVLDAPCYHMFEVFSTPNKKRTAEFWTKALQRQLTKQDWMDFIEEGGFRSGVDYPISFYYKDLMKIYPEAKVLLTVRSPEKWRKSVQDSIMKIEETFSKFPMSTFAWLAGRTGIREVPNKICNAVPDCCDMGMFNAVRKGEEEAAKFFNDWVADVKATVPKDKLLVFEVQQGWGPLCDFLGVPVPNEPFPRVNDTAQMQNNIKRAKIMSYVVVFGTPVAIGIAGYALRDKIFDGIIAIHNFVRGF